MKLTLVCSHAAISSNSFSLVYSGQTHNKCKKYLKNKYVNNINRTPTKNRKKKQFLRINIYILHEKN